MSRYSAKERQRRCELVQRFPQSGLSKSDFCRQNDLPISSFEYWLRVAKERNSYEPDEVQFVQVEVAGPKQPDTVVRGPDVEIDLPFGMKIRFFGVGVQKQ